MTVDYTSPLATSYNVFLDGQNIMNNYPNENSIAFTSIGLLSANELLFAFRRFPERTITENFNINIIWKIYFDDS